MEQFEELKKFFQEEKLQRIYAKVFDLNTINAIYSLASKNWFDRVEFVVSTGKEAHVFKAVDKAGNARAVKIYKIETSDFKQMSQYLKGDPRFRKVKMDKRSIVFAWTKKEFKNLEKAAKARVPVPIPFAFKNNVLVMAFIGEKDQAAPLLKKVKLNQKEKEKVFEQIIDGTAKLIFKAGLVHSDLSEYNFLYWKGKVYFIDIGQAVLLSHPKAKQFFERDCRNIARYFTKIGLKKSFKEVYEAVKNKKKIYI